MRSVQSCIKISPCPLDKSGFPSAVNNRFRNYGLRDSLRNKVRNEESCSRINPVVVVQLAVE